MGAYVGAAGAAPPPVCCVRHCARNCGQVSPFVVPAALATFHCSPHSFMTLWPFATFDAQKATPSTIVAPVVNPSNERASLILQSGLPAQAYREVGPLHRQRSSASPRHPHAGFRFADSGMMLFSQVAVPGDVSLGLRVGVWSQKVKCGSNLQSAFRRKATTGDDRASRQARTSTGSTTSPS